MADNQFFNESGEQSQIKARIENALRWPPPMSLTTKMNVTHYGHFRRKFNREDGHLLRTPKPRK